MVGSAELAFEAFRHCSLELPGAREEYPWGEVAWKVADRTFAIATEGCPHVCVRAESRRHDELTARDHIRSSAIAARFTWVTIDARTRPALADALRMIEESYRIVVEELPPEKRPASAR